MLVNMRVARAGREISGVWGKAHEAPDVVMQGRLYPCYYEMWSTRRGMVAGYYISDLRFSDAAPRTCEPLTRDDGGNARKVLWIQPRMGIDVLYFPSGQVKATR